MRLLIALLLFLASPGFAGEPRAELVADTILLGPDGIQAQGHARLTFEDDTVVGSEIRLDPQANTATATKGSWERPTLGTLHFEHATVDLRTGTGDVSKAEFEAVSGALNASGASLTLTEQGHLLGERVTIEPCACEGANPWSVRARKVRLKPGEHVAFTGGWFKVLDTPVLPLPAGWVPLSRRSGLLVPKFGWGSQGAVVALPVYLTLGRSADITLTPELRSQRSLRLLAEGRYALRHGSGAAELATGWDLKEQKMRGGLAWNHRGYHNTINTAVEANLVGDEAYFSDFRDKFLSRGQPFGETRLMGGWGPVELSSQLYQGAGSITQELAALRVRQPLTDIGGGLLMDSQLRGHLWAQGADPWNIDPALGGLAWAHWNLQRPTYVGPVLIKPFASAEGWWGAPLPGGAMEGLGSAYAGAEIRLPIWRSTAHTFQRLEPLVTVQGGHAMGSETEAPFALLRPPASLQIKPGLSYRWTNSQGARMELRAEGRYTDHQWSANTWLAFQRGPWSLQGQLSVPAPSMDRVVSLQLASAQIGRTDRHFDIRLAWAFSQADFLWQSRDPTPLHQARATARWTLPGSLAPLQLSGGGTFDLHSTRWFNRMLGLSYTHPTGCVRLQVEGYLSTDRVLPDLVTRIELRPGSKRSSSR